jgi:hypothetical protein
MMMLGLSAAVAKPKSERAKKWVGKKINKADRVVLILDSSLLDFIFLPPDFLPDSITVR